MKTGTLSADLISDDGRSEFYERRERRDLCAEEIKATLDLVWGGSSTVEKRVRADKSILDKGELEVLSQLDIDIRQYDGGKQRRQTCRSDRGDRTYDL